MPQTETAVREITFGEAVREALAEEMRRDPRVCILGEDVAELLGGEIAELLRGGRVLAVGVQQQPARAEVRGANDNCIAERCTARVG